MRNRTVVFPLVMIDSGDSISSGIVTVQLQLPTYVKLPAQQKVTLQEISTVK